MATGDGGSACDPPENAQNVNSLLGKLIRIKPGKHGGYSIPKDNPFAKGPGADEIYSYGLRNPFRFSFDKQTGTIAIGDVGQNTYEEIDYLSVKDALGANFGWDAYEGNEPLDLSGCPSDTSTPLPPDPVFPIHVYGHSGGDFSGCAITGGLVVRDPPAEVARRALHLLRLLQRRVAQPRPEGERRHRRGLGRPLGRLADVIHRGPRPPGLHQLAER